MEYCIFMGKDYNLFDSICVKKKKSSLIGNLNMKNSFLNLFFNEDNVHLWII